MERSSVWVEGWKERDLDRGHLLVHVRSRNISFLMEGPEKANYSINLTAGRGVQSEIYGVSTPIPFLKSLKAVSGKLSQALAEMRQK